MKSELVVPNSWVVIKNVFDEYIPPDEHPEEDILLIRKGEIHLDLGWYGGANGKYCIYLFKGNWLRGELLEKYSSKVKRDVSKRIDEILNSFETGDFEKVIGIHVDEDDVDNENRFEAIKDFTLRGLNKNDE